MRKLAYLILTIALALFFTLPANALKIAEFEILDPSITAGDSFKVNVSVSDDSTLGDLTGFGFHVDPESTLSLISFEGYDPGPGYARMIGSDNFVDGLITPTDLFNVSDPFSLTDPLLKGHTEILLATLYFKALGVGSDSLVIEGMFDGAFEGLYYLPRDKSLTGDESITGRLNININAAPVPEPATIVLVGAGLAGLAGLRRKIARN